MTICGLDFVCTCGACPEQYDVFNDDEKVGYVRLRWGGLSCEYPYVGGECIYSHGFDDGWMGCFENDEQRIYYLSVIAGKIIDKLYIKSSI